MNLITKNKDEHLKQNLLGVFLALFVMLFLLPGTASAAGVTASGTCGDDVTWTLYDDGKLVIDGTGPMDDYSSSKLRPWQQQFYNVKTVEVRDGVTKIGSNAFYNCDNLTDVTLPESLTTIARYGFGYCDTLPGITLPQGIISVDEAAFSHCYNLESVSIPESLETLGPSVFTGCTGLTDIYVDPNNRHYSSIDGVLFNQEQTILLLYPNSKGGVYAVPNGVTDLAERAFFGCINLTGITMAESLKSIGAYTFANCVNLTTVTFPKGITDIGESAFDGCEALEDISFLGGPKTIGNYAFGYCYALSRIAFYGSAPDIAKYAFTSVRKATVSYPADDPTWTGKSHQNYGGKLTWVPYSCEESGHPLPVMDPAQAPTCELAGLTAGSHCGFCGEAIVPQEVVPATGHAYNNPVFTGEDDRFSASVTLTCPCEDEITIGGQLIWEDGQFGILSVSLPRTIPGLTVWVSGYSEAGQMLSCSPAVCAGEDPLTLQVTVPKSHVKILFLNEEGTPVFPVLPL